MLRQYVEKSEAMLEEGRKFFEKGNRSAGTRCRALCQELKTMLQDIRNDIQNTKNKTKEN